MDQSVKPGSDLQPVDEEVRYYYVHRCLMSPIGQEREGPSREGRAARLVNDEAWAKSRDRMARSRRRDRAIAVFRQL